MLYWIARHGPLLMAVGVLAGLAVPPLAALFHPLLVPTLMLPLTLAYLNWIVIPLEESRLSEVFPVVYDDYRARVRRWI